MKALGILTTWGMIGAIAAGVAGISIPGDRAHAATCWELLTNAEKRWNELRGRSELPPGFERKVTRHLTEAAELRHRGRPEGCLREVQKAVDQMDLQK